MWVWFGEKILVDGEVIDGCVVVDELMFIGEFVLFEKMVGDCVVGVMVNFDGLLIVCVIVVGVDIVLV